MTCYAIALAICLQNLHKPLSVPSLSRKMGRERCCCRRTDDANDAGDVDGDDGTQQQQQQQQHRMRNGCCVWRLGERGWRAWFVAWCVCVRVGAWRVSACQVHWSSTVVWSGGSAIAAERCLDYAAPAPASAMNVSALGAQTHTTCVQCNTHVYNV